MMEVVLSVALVGVVLVAALNSVAGAKAAEAQINERAVGAVLCEALMGEVLAQAYEDEAEGVASFGKAGSEVGDGSRALFDDVDDYDGWTSTPPEDKDGAAIAWATGLTRTVEVRSVDKADLSDRSADGVSPKQVTVTVRRGDRVIASLVGYASPFWPDPRDGAWSD